ncbi:MAG TPA: hypothetical protein VMV92_00625 [Streptosporangiaceae bacterium]|nr:hypothetical protein [Streptosporangiaceae bacterium]
MAKVIAIGPGGKAQAPERSDHFGGVIDAVRAAGMLDQLVLSPRCRSREHAEETKSGLYRSARYYCSCGGRHCARTHKNIPEGSKPAGCPDGGQRISARADVVTVTGDDGVTHYHVQFRLYDKAEAVRAVVQKYGPDPEKWPYLAKRKRSEA